MRRPLVFLLLIAVFALAVCGCGGRGKNPASIVESWSRAINTSDDEAAADLFADNSTVIQNGQRIRLASHDEALLFNASLPCGGRIIGQLRSGDEITATFTLTRRPGHICGGTGRTAVAVFRIAEGKIVVWHQLPTPEPDSQSA